MNKAKFILHEMTEEERIREQARVREMAIRDEVNAIESAYAEGFAYGMVQGIVQGKAIIVRALMDNMKIGAEQAMDMLEIAKEDREKYFALLN